MFVTDTHPLVWFSTNKLSKLSDRVIEIFRKADSGTLVVYIPTCVLLEAAMLERDGKVNFNSGFERWAHSLLEKSGFIVAEMNIPIVAHSVGFNFNKDPFDKVIAATSVELDLPLITKDVAITESNLVEVYW